MAIQFWKGNKKGIIEPELFSSEAEKIAKKVYESGNSRSTLNNPSQIRKFYDEVMRIDGLIRTFPEAQQQSEFEKLLPYLKMLNAKAAYSQGRQLITSDFVLFLKESLTQVTDIDSFKVFTALFEAFIGYFVYFNKAQTQSGGRR